jgi:hypothetical protein
MTDRPFVRSAPFNSGLVRGRPLLVIVSILLAVLIAVAVVDGYIIQAIGLLTLASGLIVGLYRWRWSLYAFLIYMPVSGIPVILTYPRPELILIKDLLFIIPGYLGFVLASRRTGWRTKGVPTFALAALAFLVLIQAFNPALPNALVALLGIKVWLFYVPLIFLGYHLATSGPDLRRLLGIMSCAAIIPAVIGLIEAILLYAHQSKFVYSLYGAAAAATTQEFVQNLTGGGMLPRVPSTFTFVFQYFMFTAAMIAVAYAWWRTSGRRLAFLTWTLMVAASFTSGARGAFIMIPLLVLLIVAIDGRLGRGVAPVLAVGSLAVGAIFLFGGVPVDVFSQAGQIGAEEVGIGFLVGIRKALELTVVGLGTGGATGAARYAAPLQFISPMYGLSESWYVKSLLELGLAGLLLIVVVFGRIIFRALAVHWRLTDPGIKSVSAALLAFLVWTLLYASKGLYIDLDPTNAYLWLFSGVLLGLRNLLKPEEGSRRPGEPAGRLGWASFPTRKGAVRRVGPEHIAG